MSTVPPVTPTSTTRLIVAMVATRLKVTREDILNGRRHRKVVKARNLVAWLLRMETVKGGMSLPWIGQQLGRDHSSIHYALRMVLEWRQEDPFFFELSEKLRADVAQMLRMRRAHLLGPQAQSDAPTATEARHEPA